VKLVFAAAIALSMSGLTACVAVAPKAEPERPAITGGWSATAVTPEVTAAAEFAKKEIAAPDVTINSLGEVETQVVAGRNYRFTMNLSDGQFVKVAVWKKLDGTMELLSIARPVKDD
jgi:Cystatin domain